MGGRGQSGKGPGYLYPAAHPSCWPGRANTPCNDKEIELALGRHLQLMGGPDNLDKAMTIFTRLRTWHAGGRMNTPCNDKDIELALGRHLQLMGGTDNLEKALAIFTQLRTLAGGGTMHPL